MTQKLRIRLKYGLIIELEDMAWRYGLITKLKHRADDTASEQGLSKGLEHLL